jgi:hypothetical protein
MMKKHIYHCKLVFQGGDSLFPPQRPIEVNSRNTSISPKTPSMLEAAASSTLSPGGIELVFESNTPRKL